MIKKKLSYYNYFLILSLVLIGGYFLTSLFFLNRTSSSGEQAAIHGKTVDITNKLIEQTYQLETSAHSYLLTGCEKHYNALKEKKSSLFSEFGVLHDHCHLYDLGAKQIHSLEELLQRRTSHIEELIKRDSLHGLENEYRINFLEQGSSLTDSIISTLEVIRYQSNKKQSKNRTQALKATENAMFMLSIFGVVMIFIVLISFLKMRKEILINEKNTGEINQINIELKSMNENLENFAYVASHDLNEPLRKIRTFGDLIKDEMEQGDWDKELITSHLTRMQEASSRMQQLIHDLLSYSRITREYELSEEINLNAVVETVLSDLEVSIQELNASVIIKNLPTNIKADAVQMRQLFQNLLSNALKFHRPGITPKIVLDAKKIHSSELPIEELKNNNGTYYWAISVKDNGIGFDEKFKDKIFAVFQRLHGRSQYEGTGIGLSICKKICENHKGTIYSESSEGEGATFYVFLPVNNKG